MQLPPLTPKAKWWIDFLEKHGAKITIVGNVPSPPPIVPKSEIQEVKAVETLDWQIQPPLPKHKDGLVDRATYDLLARTAKFTTYRVKNNGGRLATFIIALGLLTAFVFTVNQTISIFQSLGWMAKP